MPHVPPIITSPPVLRSDWKTLARLASRRSKSPDLDACPTPKHPPIGFVAQLKTHSLHGFETHNKKSSRWFWGPKHQTGAIDFEIQTGKLIDLDFEAQPRNSCSSSSYARYRSLMTSPDLSIDCPPSIRPMLNHLQSSAPGLLLLSWFSSMSIMSHLLNAYHETSKRDSPHETRIRVKLLKRPEFEFKSRHVNDSSHIKVRYWSLHFSISPLMSPLTIKNTKFES
jgi:hypothetical protein